MANLSHCQSLLLTVLFLSIIQFHSQSLLSVLSILQPAACQDLSGWTAPTGAWFLSPISDGGFDLHFHFCHLFHFALLVRCLVAGELPSHKGKTIQYHVNPCSIWICGWGCKRTWKHGAAAEENDWSHGGRIVEFFFRKKHTSMKYIQTWYRLSFPNDASACGM